MRQLVGGSLQFGGLVIKALLISSIYHMVDISAAKGQSIEAVEFVNGQETINQDNQDAQPLDREDIDGMGQVNNVSQLRDVKPTDWAYESLRSLVERYGCIAGYPDSTFRGNRSLTRYEFAAGLNACLRQIEKLIASGTGDFVSQYDFAKLRKLQEDFAIELTNLRGKVDALEARTGELEATQFSTTTKLNAELITFLADAFGKEAAPRNNAILQYRARLTFDTSFTGKDRLRTRLQATQTARFDTSTKNNGPTNEARLIATGNSNNDLILNRLEYRFPVGDKLTVYLEANTIDPSLTSDPITPFAEPADGAVSNFGEINPIYVPIDNRAGIAANYKFNNALNLDVAYFGESGAGTDPSANNPSSGSGIFLGGYSAFAQLNIKPNDRFTVGLTYVNSYSPLNGVDTLTGSRASRILVNNTAGVPVPVVGNSYGIETNYRITNGFALGGWAGYTAARAIGLGDADIWNFAITLAFPDLGNKGSLGGIILGMQPKVTGSSRALGAALVANGQLSEGRSDRDTGFHIEAFYRYHLTDNILITPGFFWLTAPNHDARNPDVVIGVLRTTFLF
jgi:hypothetical protein